MQQYLNFFIDHWVLSSLFAVILILLVLNEMRGQIGISRISPANAVNLMNHENALVLDIRPKAFFKKGHVIGARNIEFKDLSDRIKKLQKFKTYPVIIICANGQQSVKAGTLLKNHSFEQVYTINGGVNAWRNANLPLTIKG